MINKLKLFLFYVLLKLLGKDFLYDQLLLSISKLDEHGKNKEFERLYTAFGADYLNSNVIRRFKSLDEGKKNKAFELLYNTLGADYLNSNIIERFKTLEADQKEQVVYLFKRSLGHDYLNSKVIFSWTKLEGMQKSAIFSKVKNSLNPDFVTESVISDFALIGGQRKVDVFNQVKSGLGEEYIKRRVIDDLSTLEITEKRDFCNQVVNVLGVDFLQDYTLERFGALSKEGKDLVFPKLIESIGEPYFKTQVINGIGFFDNGGREELFNKIYGTLGLNFLYQQMSIKFKRDASQEPSCDAIEIGLNKLSTKLLDDARYLLSPLPIEEQYSIYKQLLPRFSGIFASQEGEDVLIKRLLKEQYHQSGFYVDIGAHDPLRFSNTLHYYLQGWSGINIDPIPGMKESFDSIRSRDINIECGISQTEDIIEYYTFEESAFNTFSKSNYLSALDKTKLIDTIKVVTKPLSKVLKESLPEGQAITFMTIDVEGFELEVIKSSDWKLFRPKILCVEALSHEKSDELDVFLSGVRYSKVASTKNSNIFIDDQIEHH